MDEKKEKTGFLKLAEILKAMPPEEAEAMIAKAKKEAKESILNKFIVD